MLAGAWGLPLPAAFSCLDGPFDAAAPAALPTGLARPPLTSQTVGGSG
jgi:hypothetical protein